MRPIRGRTNPGRRPLAPTLLAFVFVATSTAVADLTSLTVVSDETCEYLNGNSWQPAVACYIAPSWPSIPGATWIWRTHLVDAVEEYDTLPPEGYRTFRKAFTISDNAYGMNGTLRITADNAYAVYLNGTFVGADGTLSRDGPDHYEWSSIETYTIAALPGVNVIEVRAVNYFRLGHGTGNPSGLLFRLDVSYFSPATPVAVDDHYSVNEDQELVVPAPGVLANDTDPSGGMLMAVLVSDVGQGTLSLDVTGAFTYKASPNYSGTDSFTYLATNGDVDSNEATVTILVTEVNDPPVAADDAYTVEEDGSLNVVAPGVLANDTDVEGNALTCALVSGTSHGVLSFNSDGSFTYTPEADFFGADGFTYKAKDAESESNTATVSIEVTAVNDPPVVGPITVSADEVAVDTPIDASAAFSDPDAGDTHVAQWNWGDGEVSAGSVDETNGSVTGMHTYTEPGFYTITLTVTDSAGASGEAVYQYVVVYGSSGDFVTGGGWILAPKGSYPANPFLTGVANFGFVVKYLKGDDVPKGQTQFNFRVGRLNFHSTAYEWLVVSGSQARFKGTGRINREEGYGFQVSVTDGQINGGGGVDRFRIRIWNAGGETVFDNGVGGGDDALGGGDIVIHRRE